MVEAEPDDEKIVARFQESGDTELLDALVRRHVPGVRNMIYAMVLNTADADDLTQETFVRAIRGIAGFRRRARFSTWLYRIAMNTTRSFLSRKRRSPVLYRENPAESSTSPNAATDNDALDPAIHAALASLSPRLRAAIVLTGIRGLRAREAARVEGCSAATLYWRLHQARKILRERLREHFPA